MQQNLPLSHFVTFSESCAPLFSCVSKEGTYLAAEESSSASAALTNPNPCSRVLLWSLNKETQFPAFLGPSLLYTSASIY